MTELSLKMFKKITQIFNVILGPWTRTYTNGSRNCPLCLQEKYEILFYANKGELLNKRSELIAKCRHSN